MEQHGKRDKHRKAVSCIQPKKKGQVHLIKMNLTFFWGKVRDRRMSRPCAGDNLFDIY